MDHPRELSLDMVRGLAILLVLVFHLNQPTGSAALDTLIAPVAVAGWAGVDLFFVLSGFLVGRIVLTEAASPAGFDVRRFFLRRALRLWPVLWLYLAALLLAGGASAWPMVWPALLHVQNYAEGVPSHLWSLAVEEHFYLAAALALPWLLARGGARGVIAALVASLVASAAWRIGALAAGETLRHAQWQTQYRIDGLAVGVLLAALQLYRPAIFAALIRQRLGALAVAAVGFAWLATTREDATRYGIGLVAAWIMGAALVVAASGAAIPAALRHPARTLGWLGTIAYSLYIWHASVAQVATAAAPALGLTGPAAVFAFRLGAAIAVAALVHRLVEAPFLRARARLGSATRSVRGASPAAMLRQS